MLFHVSTILFLIVFQLEKMLSMSVSSFATFLPFSIIIMYHNVVKASSIAANLIQ